MNTLRRTSITSTFHDTLTDHLTLNASPLLLCAIIIFEFVVVSAIPSFADALRPVLLPTKSDKPPAFNTNRALRRMQQRLEQKKRPPDRGHQQPCISMAINNINGQAKLPFDRSCPSGGSRHGPDHTANNPTLEAKLIVFPRHDCNPVATSGTRSAIEPPQVESRPTKLIFNMRNSFSRTEKNGAVYWANLKEICSQTQRPAESGRAREPNTLHPKRGNDQSEQQQRGQGVGRNNKKQKTVRDDQNENSGDGKGGGRRAPGGSSNAPSSHMDIFACPFALFDPHKYPRCLVGYDFKRVTDVVQHLVRCHVVDHQRYCPRCWTVFEETEQCNLHIISNGCNEIPRPTGSGLLLDSDLETIRNNMAAVRGAKNKWNQMWQTLFHKNPPKSPYNLPVISAVREVLERDLAAALSENLNHLVLSWCSRFNDGDNLDDVVSQMRSDIMHVYATADPTRPQWSNSPPTTQLNSRAIANTIAAEQQDSGIRDVQNTTGEGVHINKTRGVIEPRVADGHQSFHPEYELDALAGIREGYQGPHLIDGQDMDISRGNPGNCVSRGPPQAGRGLNQEDTPQLIHPPMNEEGNPRVVPGEPGMGEWGVVENEAYNDAGLEHSHSHHNGYTSPGELLDMYVLDNGTSTGEGSETYNAVTYLMDNDADQGGDGQLFQNEEYNRQGWY